MKAKTKIEIAVKNLESKLPELTEKQITYAVDRLFPKQCYATKNKSFCLECGNDVDVKSIINEKVICPSCNAKLEVVRSRKTIGRSELKCIGLACVIKHDIYDFQITRVFDFRVNYRKGRKKHIVVWETNQRWYDGNSKKIVINSMLESGFNGCFIGGLEIRKPHFSSTYYTTIKYDPFPWFFLPESKFRPDLKKRGVTRGRLADIQFSTLLEKMEKSPKIETLLKRGFIEIIEKWSLEEIDQYWPALKMCFRNNYKIKSIQSYKDLLEALVFLDKDLHNPHHVCPDDFVRAHDFYINLKTKKELAETGLTDRDKIELSNPRYLRDKGNFLHLNFVSGDFSVRPLQNVEEFYEEGKLFKHCIFSNSYFGKKNSLLFSGRYEGMRVETFELDLRTFKILQSHGLGHKKSKHSKKMEQLILKNIDKIKACMQPKKNKKNKNHKIAS